MRRYLYVSSFLVVFTALAVTGTAYAAVPSLQVAPLSYSGDLVKNTLASGFIDVSNPTDTTIQVSSQVKGFHQTDAAGDLAFYDDSRLKNAVSVALPNFSLGPREAIRVAFTINPADLPPGGVYGAIFFRTNAPAQTSNSSFVVQSANVGTLLILNNGGILTHQATISLSSSFIQLGSGLSGIIRITNANTASDATAFRPSLSSQIYPWGRQVGLSSGLILPGVTRQFSFKRPGAFFGLVPLAIRDSVTGAHTTRWVLADTGYFTWALPLAIVIVVLLLILLKSHILRVIVLIRRFLQTMRGKPKPARRPMDGLSRRSPVTRVVGPSPDAPVIPDPQVSDARDLDQAEPAPAESSVLDQLEAEARERDAGLAKGAPDPEGKVKATAPESNTTQKLPHGQTRKVAVKAGDPKPKRSRKQPHPPAQT